MSTNTTVPITFDDSEIKDALIYSSINNILNQNNFINQNASFWDKDTNGNPKANTTKTNGFINFLNSVGTNTNDPNASLNTLLSNTTIKRACCLKNTDVDDPNHYKVNVKLPYVDALVPLSNVQKLSLYKKYNFICFNNNKI